MHKLVEISPLEIDEVIKIKEEADSDIYLCGGGKFASWLLDNNLIDQLKIKLNPITLGKGIPLFGNSGFAAKWNLRKTEAYDYGLLMLTYELSTG